MKRWPSALWYPALGLTALAVSGCVNAPMHPTGLGFPAPNAPQMLAPVFDSTRYLDCISADLSKAGVDSRGKLAVHLTPMPNTAGAKVGRIDLPPSLQPFARASFDRVSSGFRLLSDDDRVHLRLSGSMYAASPFRVLDGEVEAVGFGLGLRVEAVDISIQLFWEARDFSAKGKIFEQSGTGVTVNLRLFAAEQGSSAFVVTSGKNGLVLGRTRASQEATPRLAIQSAVNVAVAALVSARAARQWGITSSCDLGDDGRTAIPRDTSEEPFKAAIDVRLALTRGQLCAQLKQRRPLPRDIDGAVLEVSEFRAEGIELRRNTIRVAPLDELMRSNQSVCFPKGAFDERAEEIRFWFKTRGGHLLGGAGYFFAN